MAADGADGWETLFLDFDEAPMDELVLFSEALSRIDPVQRAAYLDQACGDDNTLRQRIDKLLAMHESETSILDRPPQRLFEELENGTKNTGDEGAALDRLLEPSTRPGALGRLQHYDVLEVLGQGGFGIVVKAFDDNLHRVVAIKILNPEMAATSAPRKRFLREARAAAQVKHENVVQIYAVEEQPIPYLVMEYVEGPTLQQQLDDDGPLDPPEVARLGVQIARGLAAAHDRGLIHRDVKPGNVMIEAGPEPRARLTDFGLARTGDDASLTQSGMIAGTPLYMSPEQARGEALDQRADLFSLGSVLYTMVTGRPPFRARNTVAVLKRVVEDAPRPICQVIDGVPVGLCAVIRRLLEKNPAERFATAREAAAALERCLTDPSCGTKCQAPTRPARGLRRWLAYSAGALMLASAVALGVWGVEKFGGIVRETERRANFGSGSERREMPNHAVERHPTATSLPPDAIVVTSPLDDGSEGTLRWAVNEANSQPGPNFIGFDPNYFSTPQTIKLTQDSLTLTDSAETTIIGPAAGLTISGDNMRRVFRIGVVDGARVMPACAWIEGLTIARGLATGQPAMGGGVLCMIDSRLMLVGCTLRDNVAPDGGGGVFNYEGTVTATNCTFTRNTAGAGGGLCSFGGRGKAKITHCTFAANSSGAGAGLQTNGGARTEVYHSLFNWNTGQDIVTGEGGETTGDYNLTADSSAPGSRSITNADALLGSLGHHGGPTEAFFLRPGSPAIDAGSNEHVPSGITTDQRGSPRVANGKADLGALEAQ
jgi:serine/threonine protein kinase